jgi:hypothetical protein
MNKRITILLLVISLNTVFAQNLLLNGSFENNTATNYITDLTNIQYNQVINYSTSFGDNINPTLIGEIDLLKDSLQLYSIDTNWVIYAQNGEWFIAAAAKGYNYINSSGDTLPFWFSQDAFSLELSDSLDVGQWYELSFYMMHKHPPNGYPAYLPGRLSLGLSNYPDSFGVIIDTTLFTDTLWTKQSFTFQVTSNFKHITCRPVREVYGMNWVFVDNFVLRETTASGVEELTTEKEGFTMYPNPTKNVINIKADLSSRGKAILNILDSKGQVINSYTIFNNIELTLNLKHLPNALYLCQIVSNDGVSLHTEKLAIFR